MKHRYAKSEESSERRVNYNSYWTEGGGHLFFSRHCSDMYKQTNSYGNVPDRSLRNCPDPEISGTSLMRVFEGGATQDKPDLALSDAGKKRPSKDGENMSKECFLLIRDMTQQSQLPTENIVCIQHESSYIVSACYTCIVYQCVLVLYFFKENKSHGASLHALILCLHANNWLSCLEQVTFIDGHR
jgi:hypothetical protein